MRLRSFAEIDKTWHEDKGVTPQGWNLGTTTLTELLSKTSGSISRFDKLLEFTVWSIVGLIVLSLASLLFLASH
jgi:hypothetical protein